jgi:hypothetical protein
MGPVDEGASPTAGGATEQPMSVKFLQLQDAFKRMVAVGVDVVDEQVRAGGRRGAAAAEARRAARQPRRPRPTPAPRRPSTVSWRTCQSICCSHSGSCTHGCARGRGAAQRAGRCQERARRHAGGGARAPLPPRPSVSARRPRAGHARAPSSAPAPTRDPRPCRWCPTSWTTRWTSLTRSRAMRACSSSSQTSRRSRCSGGGRSVRRRRAVAPATTRPRGRPRRRPPRASWPSARRGSSCRRPSPRWAAPPQRLAACAVRAAV